MAEPIQTTAAEAQLLTGRGVLETACLVSGASEASTCTLYDGTSAADRFLYALAAVTADSAPAGPLNIPFKTGIFSVLAGSNAILTVTIK